MAGFYGSAPKFTEKEARKEKSLLSGREKAEVKEDLYGELNKCHETEEFISAKLQELKIELDNIPDKVKVSYNQACEQGAEYTEDENDLTLFLRRENFRAKPAAKRIVTYWLQRIELFGRDLAFRPLSLHSYTLSEVAFHLLEGRDHAGRSLLFQNSVFNVTTLNRDSILRVLWCLCHEILKITEPKANNRGHVVMVCTAANADIENFDRKLQCRALDSMVNIIPLKIAAMHWCHPTKTFISYILPVLRKVMGKELRQRCLLHSGSEKKVLEALGTFGIANYDLPVDIGGNIVLRQTDQKCEKRRNHDEMKRKRRLEANRRSAAASRQRRLDLIEELTKSVSHLKEKITSLQRENVELRRHLNEDPLQQQGLGAAMTRCHGQGDIFGVAPPQQLRAAEFVSRESTTASDGKGSAVVPWIETNHTRQTNASSSPFLLPLNSPQQFLHSSHLPKREQVSVTSSVTAFNLKKYEEMQRAILRQHQSASGMHVFTEPGGLQESSVSQPNQNQLSPLKKAKP